jgi:methylmalonyl-CoA mutase
VNTFLSKEHRSETAATVELIRSTDDEKTQQILNTEAFRSARQRALAARANEAGNSIASLAELRRTAEERRNTFASLMEAVKYHSLGQITGALYEVGGEYRRNM